ncbi:MAG TPA: M20/M25/M40 family metallo-hydrolase [Actinomycetota bacterium]|nr:M20/M25/M40 family metallo-hydrolase [Actinomycetota bacterium]
MPPFEVYPRPLKTAPPSPAVTVDPADAKWAGTLPDKFVATLVELVTTSNLKGWVEDLSAFHTRHSASAFIGQAADWIKARFTAFGYADVAFHEYAFGNGTLKNVVCTKPGTDPQPRVVVLCGHYDCIMEDHDDAVARAPGADDNASGIAAILEIARILRHVPTKDTIRFVAFSGEEQGLKGSTAYAAHVQGTGVNLHRLINLDMIAFPPADGSIVVERDMGNQTGTNDAASQAFGDVMAQMGIDYTTLPIKLGPIYASDYMPFEARGYVVIGAYEGEGNPNYHNDSDTPATLSYPYLTEATKMTLATLVTETLGVKDEPNAPVDVYIRDSAADTGSQPSPVPHWQSPDIWVRNNPPPADPNDPNDPNAGENPDAGHQPPINDQPNYIYVTVRNRGPQQAAPGSMTLRVYRCDPGTGMIWPNHFQEIGTEVVAPAIPPNGSVRVGPFIWTPHIVGHECLLAIASGAADRSVPDVIGAELNHALLVRFDNNVGQRNVEPQMSVGGGKTKATIFIRGGLAPSTNRLLLDASAMPSDTKIHVRTLRRVVDPATRQHLSVEEQTQVWSTMKLAGGKVGELSGFPLKKDDRVSVELTIDFSVQGKHLEVYPLVCTQEQDAAVAGRITVEITAVKELEDFVFANPRSGELHVSACPFWDAIGPGNKVPYQSVEEGLARGYNGCAYCLPEHDTG